MTITAEKQRGLELKIQTLASEIVLPTKVIGDDKRRTQALELIALLLFNKEVAKLP